MLSKNSPDSLSPLILVFFFFITLITEVVLYNIYVFAHCLLPLLYIPLECMFHEGKGSICCIHLYILSTKKALST